MEYYLAIEGNKLIHEKDINESQNRYAKWKKSNTKVKYQWFYLCDTQEKTKHKWDHTLYPTVYSTMIFKLKMYFSRPW